MRYTFVAIIAVLATGCVGSRPRGYEPFPDPLTDAPPLDLEAPANEPLELPLNSGDDLEGSGIVPDGTGRDLGGPEIAPTDIRAASDIDMEIDAPTEVTLGDNVTFVVQVQNDRAEDLSDVIVECEFDPAFAFPGRDASRIEQTIDQLPSGRSRTMKLTLDTQAVGEACARFRVLVDGTEMVWKSICVTIQDADE